MNAQLNYIVAQQRIADLHRAAEHARLATDAGTGRRDSRDANSVTHLRARLARLTTPLASTGRRDANDTAQTPFAPDPVADISAPTKTSPADVL